MMSVVLTAQYITSGPILGLRPANERQRYFVTPSLIGWVQAQNQPCHIISPEHYAILDYHDLAVCLGWQQK